MAITLFSCIGGAVALPDRNLVLADRLDGGHLIVDPPRAVWDRSELQPSELKHWSFLVAATGKAMIDALPQLQGGCINYWDAGNWALNVHAEPIGAKTAPAFRQTHMHLLGRSRNARTASHQWGEAPRFPDFANRHDWARPHQRLSPDECQAIVLLVEVNLRERYRLPAKAISAWQPCPGCKLPVPGDGKSEAATCPECKAPSSKMA